MVAQTRSEAVGRAVVAVALALAAATGCDGSDDVPATPVDAGSSMDAAELVDAAPWPWDGRPPPWRHDAQCGPADASPRDAGRDWDGGPSGALAVAGAYDVGVTTVEVVDAARARTLPVEIWYPIARGSSAGTPNAYYLDVSFGTLGSVCSRARRDAPTAGDGPWPLVLFSHGFGGIRFQSFFLTEHLASHGFVVAAPDHVNNTIADFAMLSSDAATAQSAVDRPLDMQRVLDRMLADAGGLGLSIDSARVAISGHSFGAWTSIETARRDARFRVVVPLAPGFRDPSTPAIAAELARPLMIFGGSADHTTPFDESQQAPYDVALAPKALVKVLGAGHFDFSDLCDLDVAAPIARGDGCNPASVDPEIVHARVRVLALAFLERYLNGDAAVEPLLEPSAVTALGDVEYSRAP